MTIPMRSRSALLLAVVGVLLFTLFVQIAYAASEGPLNPGTGSTDTSFGTVSWTNASNITASDNSDASTGFISAGASSHYLTATNFGFSIPSGATIDGIVAEWERANQSSFWPCKDSRVRIIKGGTIGSTDKASASTWPDTDTYASYGGASDLWGETWTHSDINGSTFGVALSVTNSGSQCIPNVDHARITVYYTAGGGGGSETSYGLIY